MDTVFSRPKLAATLSATFAQLLGFWNDIFPKSTNVIIIFSPIIFLISFFKDKVLILLWLFLMLFFSGKLSINGLMDGMLALYFVASVLIVHKISITKTEREKKLVQKALKQSDKQADDVEPKVIVMKQEPVEKDLETEDSSTNEETTPYNNPYMYAYPPEYYYDNEYDEDDYDDDEDE